MAWLMWHAAALFRSGGKKLPELSIFLSKRTKGDETKKPVAAPNEDAILAWLVASKNKHEEKKAKK